MLRNRSCPQARGPLCAHEQAGPARGAPPGAELGEPAAALPRWGLPAQAGQPRPAGALLRAGSVARRVAVPLAPCFPGKEGSGSLTKPWARRPTASGNMQVGGPAGVLESPPHSNPSFSRPAAGPRPRGLGRGAAGWLLQPRALSSSSRQEEERRAADKRQEQPTDGFWAPPTGVASRPRSPRS